VTEPNTTPITEADVRQLETSTGARFQAVNARFLMVDGRFATLGDRLNDIGQELADLYRSTARRCVYTDRAIDNALARLDQIHTDLTAETLRMHRDLRRVVILGLLGTVVCTAGLCLGTLLLVL
jgi:hypothetical protein